MTNWKPDSTKAEKLANALSRRVPDSVQDVISKMDSYGPQARRELTEKYGQQKVEEAEDEVERCANEILAQSVARSSNAQKEANMKQSLHNPEKFVLPEHSEVLSKCTITRWNYES